MFNNKYSDQEYIVGIRSNERIVINSFCSENLEAITKLVVKKGGTITDVDDIMQEGMLILYVSVRVEDFLLSCKLRTYFFAICKNTWLRLYKSRKNEQTFYERMFSLPAEEQPEIDTSIEVRRLNLYYKCLMLLSTECQQIIKMREQEISYEEITQHFNLQNHHIARNKKNNCKEKLRNLIINHKDYKYLSNEE